MSELVVLSSGGARLTVVAVDERTGADAGVGVDVERWQRLASDALVAEGVDAGELNLLFVDVDTMTALNEEHMGGTGPTDVLAFPIDGEAATRGGRGDGGDGVPVLLGDVIICPAVARDNAARQSTAVDDEMALLVVHGVLHILGHDHAEPDETALMRAREQALLGLRHRP